MEQPPYTAIPTHSPAIPSHSRTVPRRVSNPQLGSTPRPAPLLRLVTDAAARSADPAAHVTRRWLCGQRAAAARDGAVTGERRAGWLGRRPRPGPSGVAAVVVFLWPPKPRPGPAGRMKPAGPAACRPTAGGCARGSRPRGRPQALRTRASERAALGRPLPVPLRTEGSRLRAFPAAAAPACAAWR